MERNYIKIFKAIKLHNPGASKKELRKAFRIMHTRWTLSLYWDVLWRHIYKSTR